MSDRPTFILELRPERLEIAKMAESQVLAGEEEETSENPDLANPDESQVLAGEEGAKSGNPDFSGVQFAGFQHFERCGLRPPSCHGRRACASRSSGPSTPRSSGAQVLGPTLAKILAEVPGRHRNRLAEHCGAG
jgi:hypothetical protein